MSQRVIVCELPCFDLREGSVLLLRSRAIDRDESMTRLSSVLFGWPRGSIAGMRPNSDTADVSSAVGSLSCVCD